MNPNLDLTLSLAADGSALPSLFFRPADRLRLEGCVAAVCQEGRSLALSSQYDAALDHYGRLLTERLRSAAPNSHIETYFPASTDALVTRFNEVLAGRTVREAMSEGASRASERIWVVHDAGSLAEHELQLLARLVSHFPGANIRVVLLLGPALRSRKAFESLGRRFVRWDIEAPTVEQAQTMLEQARVEGCEGMVAHLLRHLQPGVVMARQAEFASDSAPFGFSSVDQAQSPRKGADEAPASSPSVLARGRQALQGRWTAIKGPFADRLAGILQRWRERRAGTAPLSLRSGAAGLTKAGLTAGTARMALRLPKARWVLTIGALIGLSVSVSAWLHGSRFGTVKPAAQQPVKDVRTGVSAPGRIYGPSPAGDPSVESSI